MESPAFYGFSVWLKRLIWCPRPRGTAVDLERNQVRAPALRIRPMTKQTDTLALAGRILIGAPFLLSGLGKLAAASATVGYIAYAGLPAPLLAYLGAVAIELVGGTFLIVGFRVRIVASVLAVFA